MLRKLSLVLFGLFLCLGVTWAQTKITGTVISADDGEPVIGATISVEGTKKRAVTDINGKFSLAVDPGTMLRFACVGMKPHRAKAHNGMRVT